MFLGHFAVAFATKRLAPRASLGTLVFAAQFADLLWPLLLLAGVEVARVQPGATVMTPLVFVDYPWSHSLLGLAAAGIALGLVYGLRQRGRAREALVLALLVPSHWLLDWLVHAPDLPLLPGAQASLHGLGLWNSPATTLALDLGCFVAGAALYLRSTQPRDRIGTLGFGALLVFLGLVYAGNVFGGPPPDMRAVAWVGLAQWLLVAWAAWADRHRRITGNFA